MKTNKIYYQNKHLKVTFKEENSTLVGDSNHSYKFYEVDFLGYVWKYYCYQEDSTNTIDKK